MSEKNGNGNDSGTGAGRIAAELSAGPLRPCGTDLCEVAAAVKLFGRSIGHVATGYDQFTEDEKARAQALITKGIRHIADLWKAMLNNG